MPAVKPTMRRKRRYILFAIECESPSSVNEQTVKRASYDAIMRFLGEYGAALAVPKFIGFEQKTGLAVLRCNHTEVEKVKAALALVSKFEGKRAAFRLKKVSGTIESLGVELKRKERPPHRA